MLNLDSRSKIHLREGSPQYLLTHPSMLSTERSLLLLLMCLQHVEDTADYPGNGRSAREKLPL